MKNNKHDIFIILFIKQTFNMTKIRPYEIHFIFS